MTQGLNAIVFTGSPRRIRVICTGPLAIGAFTSLSYYAVTNTDSLGAATINVVQVFAIGSNPNAFELAIDSDLTPGAMYQVAVTGLPFADSSTLTGTITAGTPAQANATILNTEPGANDFDPYFFGVDLLQSDSGDLAETATGDLATVTGRGNWISACLRRVMGSTLLWAPGYGGEPDQFVNAPGVFALPLSAVAVGQCRADDRTDTATCAVIPDANGAPGLYFFQLTLTSKDGQDPASITLPVPILLSGTAHA